MYKISEEKNGIAIVGIDDSQITSSVLIIPETVDGKIVTKIGDHAFYGLRQIEKAIVPDTVIEIDKYAFAECRGLVHIQLSNHLQKIGDYAFYNCHQLMRVNLPSALKNMGYGAFKNCSEMKKIDLYTDEKNELSVGALIEDTSHELGVDLYGGDGQLLTKLVFTEFDYDCILQVEARQFDWVYHGSGNVYRQCISAKGIDFAKYDALFPSAVREDWPETAIQIALGRVLYPYKLYESHRKQYVEFLIKQKQKVFEYFLKDQSCDEFEKLLPEIADEACISAWIEEARRPGKMNFVSLLMDYQQKNYKKKEKSFDFDF